jgi:hypothetical protein
MNKALWQLAVAFCLVAAGALCFHRFACDTPSAGESRLHILPEAVGEYLDGVALSTELQTRAENNHRRIQAKYAVVTELIAGRLMLREAAARFGELDADVPGIRDRLAQHYPGASYEVALCHEVIEQARSVLRVRALEQRENLLARLEAELKVIQESEEGDCLP